MSFIFYFKEYIKWGFLFNGNSFIKTDNDSKKGCSGKQKKYLMTFQSLMHLIPNACVVLLG